MDSQPLKANVKPSHKDTVAKAVQIAGELAEERLKIDRAPQHHFTGGAEYPGITGRMKLDWVAGYFRNRWPDDPGLRISVLFLIAIAWGLAGLVCAALNKIWEPTDRSHSRQY